MILKNRIEKLLSEYNDEKFNLLWVKCKEIVEDVKQHNKQINSQMSNYDIHDEAHSEKVIEIIEELLDDKLNMLSCYELILVYLSAYLHDSAMALPQWEYDILKTVEGTDELYDNTINFRVCNDFKPVHKLSDAMLIIRENQPALFDFNTARNYIFAEKSEEDMIMSLAELLCSYEEFRNGYISELESNRYSVVDYNNISKLIRSEFIRQTHHIRVTKNIKALNNKFKNAIGSFYSEKLVQDLGNICKCHGENIESIFDLDCIRQDWMQENSNIQFIAILLRLGDVIHFSSDRAPLSLFAEKRIEDETSFIHWKAKFQELTFDFYKDKELIGVKYTAFCSAPEVYYFIQDYLDLVDSEIDNYYVLKQRWERNKLQGIDKYTLPLISKVDRCDIDFDSDIFIPKTGMKFVLNQAKILELLMGIQLYKDEFLCLREIYQNALDATKCIIAYNKTNGITEKLNIEFGIKEELVEGIKQKYIYCLDHGTGMDEYIINNFLLHIGNSYYKSKEFSKKNTSWKFNVSPTSQFGIGILSGYMIADKIGITSVYYENSSVESFILEGVNEHFYNVQPSKIDIENIGKHGTIIKLYLKKEYADKINTKYIKKLPLLLMVFNNDTRKKICDIKDWEFNLSYILSKYIGIFNPDIPVCVKGEDDTVRFINQSNTIFDIKNYDEIQNEDIEKIWKYKYYMDGSKISYKEFLEKQKHIENYSINITSENMEIYSYISLPKKNYNGDNLRMFNFCSFIGRNEGSILVDGIKINRDFDSTSEFVENLGYDIVERSLFNFIGKIRPTLSVDRTTCVKMPPLEKELEQVKIEYATTIKDIICDHVEKESIGLDDIEFTLILNIVATQFPSIASKVFNLLCDTKYSKAKFPDNTLLNSDYTLEDFLKNYTITISDINFTKYKEITRQIILNRAIKADIIDVVDDLVTIKGNNLYEFMSPKHYYRGEDLSLSTVAIKADSWEGKFKEYDIVNTVWPIVNPNLFSSLCDFEIEEITFRCKTISNVGNGIQGIAKLDPVMIDPAVGISSKQDDGIRKNKNYVGFFDNIQHSYWLFELSNHGQKTRESKKSPALFVYIAPRELNEEEIERLKEFETPNPQYVKGIREGWSILFLGQMSKYIICPGIVSKQHISSLIPQSYKTIDKDIEYYYTDGSKVY